eukprot:gnl/TRDRNA2_/TRDRNA2_178034_c0_seq1.p1 gnl/TRDRNA2_/TRDRNA2_178034_c0~~gnl/TRDRNA2_/TRDRNA2_178034_c0_seq1.p1  ORF type:complete len:160 (-),score=64.48 gnl/TRDRNA2_/TRDRNA2_178034_c0_seq1:127-606(-)
MDDGKQVFVDKLAELKVVGGPVEDRAKQDQHRPELAKVLMATAKLLKEKARKPDAKLKDAEPANLKKMEAAAQEAEEWLSGLLKRQEKHPKHQDPILSATAIATRITELGNVFEDAMGKKSDATPADAQDMSVSEAKAEEPKETPPPAQQPQSEAVDVD